MIMKIYAIKDTKIGFMQPFYLQNDGVALREVTNAANEPQKNSVNTNAEDKELWLLGTFNDLTGEVTSEIRHLACVKDLTNKGE